jgi:hypothetical protein
VRILCAAKPFGDVGQAARRRGQRRGATFRGEFAAGGSLAYRLDTAHLLALTDGASFVGGGNIGVRAGIMGEL